MDQVVSSIEQKFLCNCRDGKIIKLETNEIPKPKSHEFFDPRTGEIRRVCLGWESVRKWFGARLKCASYAEKKRADRDPNSYLEYFKRKGTYHFIVQNSD